MTAMSKGFIVTNPGVLTLVQDLGRFGYQHVGLAPGGAADEHAFLWANRLLGNPPNSPALEICLGGLQLEAELPTRIALTGADAQATLNGQRLAPWQTANVEPRDRLQFGHPKSGVRSYLAVQGGFQVAPTFGSVATVMRERLGGLDGAGGPLRKGDYLPCAVTRVGTSLPDNPSLPENLSVKVPPAYVPDYNEVPVLRVIEGHHAELFEEQELEVFYSSDYLITNQSDRMGARLSGPSLAPQRPGIISEGTSFGAVQVPPDGQPMVLLKDRQTIGGYPKLGTVFSLDAFALAQRQPHTKVRFEPMDLAQAQQLLSRFYGFFRV